MGQTLCNEKECVARKDACDARKRCALTVKEEDRLDSGAVALIFLLTARTSSFTLATKPALCVCAPSPPPALKRPMTLACSELRSGLVAAGRDCGDRIQSPNGSEHKMSALGSCASTMGNSA